VKILATLFNILKVLGYNDTKTGKQST